MIPRESIVTPRLTITDFVRDDITTEYLGWLNDAALMRFSSQRQITHTPLTAIAYVEGFEGSENRFVAIRLRSSREMVGTATMYWRGATEGVDIGILIGVPGNGYGKEAFRALTLALLDAGLPRVTAGTAVGNAAMIALARAAGMREFVKTPPDGAHRYFELTR